MKLVYLFIKLKGGYSFIVKEIDGIQYTLYFSELKWSIDNNHRNIMNIYSRMNIDDEYECYIADYHYIGSKNLFKIETRKEETK